MATTKPTKRVEAFTHEESRLNIPTEELSGFLAQDEEAPATMLYPRDPSLDPQLVWKGKDEQDREELAVPVVPIYIQEKIHPQAIITDIQSRSKTGGIGEGVASYDQADFFAQFNGIEDFGDRIDFYQHEQHWSNRMILGDSLLVMTSLAEKEGLNGEGPDDLFRSAVWDQIWQQLAGQHAQTGCEGRQRDRRDPAAGAGEGVPGYVEAGDSFLSGVFAGSIDGCSGFVDGVGEYFRSDWG
jgi:hypothetical protein